MTPASVNKMLKCQKTSTEHIRYNYVTFTGACFKGRNSLREDCCADESNHEYVKLWRHLPMEIIIFSSSIIKISTFEDTWGLLNRMIIFPLLYKIIANIFI